ncbi:anterior gradient 1 [Astyanax mexicanus]|uniref:Anterior gradient protein 3-like n=2 Tax=Astyanax mexicanus TaxID=7994 RepID=A0A8B9KX96_ASTMX|nr:anterior gradient 1 [Astyanax mexicanus]KAG9271632.1 anterior gradient protein 3-like [Astyanax mexicanus]
MHLHHHEYCQTDRAEEQSWFSRFTFVIMGRWCVYALLFFLSCDVSMQRKKKVVQTLSRGWGDDITWVQTYEEGLSKMRASNKPLMVIHHLEECPHSQALKKVFAENKNIQRMAQSDFIMLNLMHETTDANLAPDGRYVPRILFVDPSMTVRNDITGKYHNRLYTYQPDDADLLVKNMEKAKILLSEHTEL